MNDYTVSGSQRPVSSGHGPVWPSGKALGWQAEVPRFDTASALFSLRKRLWFVDTVL